MVVAVGAPGPVGGPVGVAPRTGLGLWAGGSIGPSPLGPAAVVGDRGGKPFDDDGALTIELLDGTRLPDRCGRAMGFPRLVDRLMISFPCTIKLSFDFLRSRVSISMTSSVYAPSIHRGK